MKNIVMIAFLTLIWCGFGYRFNWGNILLGIVVSTACCFVLPSDKTKTCRVRVFPLLSLVGFIVLELIKSSIIVAWDVVTPGHTSQPKILEIELSCQHNVQRMVLANLISLTPGTLSIDLSEDNTKLSVHVMFAHDPSRTRDFIKHRLEPKVLEVFKYANVK